MRSKMHMLDIKEIKNTEKMKTLDLLFLGLLETSTIKSLINPLCWFAISAASGRTLGTGCVVSAFNARLTPSLSVTYGLY